MDEDYIISNTEKVKDNYKEECRFVEYDDFENIDNKLIHTCLSNNHEYIMKNQLNLITYTGPIF